MKKIDLYVKGQRGLFSIGMIIMATVTIISSFTILSTINKTKITVERETYDRMNNMEKQTFNAQFTLYYEGNSLNAATVRALISRIQASNATNTEHHIEYTAPDIKTTNKYKVELNYDNDGYVSEIIITENYN